MKINSFGAFAAVRSVCLLCLLWMIAAVGAAAEPGLPAITRHSGMFHGRQIAYTAAVEPVVVADESGKPAARVVAISYVASGTSDLARRPVLFAFNGGPISPSDVLHMGMLGPKRVAIPDDVNADPATYRVVENSYMPLDAADIVLFDPASTGFSRVLPGVDPKRYFSVTTDGQQLAQFIVEWCRKHGRLDSPKYVLGESYGTMRAAAVANQLQKLPHPVPLKGVILLGQALNIIEFSQRPANIISYVVSLPTLAAIAWSRGKANLHGKDFDAFQDEVWQFARTDYLTALFQGSKLPTTVAKTVAQRLQDYTGISAAYYLADDLEITKEQYRRELYRDKSQILGMIDARYTGHNAGPKTEDPAGVITKAYETAFKTYLRDDLGIADTADYITKDPVHGLEDWKWDGTGTSPFADWPYPKLLSEVFAANPDFRLMIGNGWEDTQTTVGAARYLVDRSDWPADRVSLHFYQGGHTAYSVEASLKQMTDDIRAMIAVR